MLTIYTTLRKDKYIVAYYLSIMGDGITLGHEEHQSVHAIDFVWMVAIYNLCHVRLFHFVCLAMTQCECVLMTQSKM
jgi:hypothetical protein